MPRVIVQVGWKRTRREGQKLSAWVNGDVIDWNSFPGKWLTPQAQRDFMMWHLCELDLETGDQIQIQCLTGIRGKGKDETRTFDLVYAVGEETDEVLQYELPGVGFAGRPVIKGRVHELANVTDWDRRQMDVEQFLDAEF